MAAAHYLECNGCGAPVLERDEPWWQEDEQETCQECGLITLVSIDDWGGEPRAYLSGDDEYEDVGQARCDLSPGCDWVEEYRGEPCHWQCPRVGLVALLGFWCGGHSP